MKNTILMSVALLFSMLLNAQLVTTEKTSVLPEGTYFQRGQVMIKNGYHAVPSADNKVVTIQRISGNGITGSYACACQSGTGSNDCETSQTPNSLSCRTQAGNCKGCILVTTTDPKAAVIKYRDAVKWKRVAAQTAVQ